MTTSCAKRNRLPRLQRVDKQELLPAFRLTQRDIAIIKAVYEFRALTTPQIEALFFAGEKPGAPSILPKAGSNSRCLHRLKLLFHAGFLMRREQPTLLAEGRKPFIYLLDERGAQLIAQEQGIERAELDFKPKDRMIGEPFLEHLLTTNTVRIAIEHAAKHSGLSILTWVGDKALKSPQMKDTVTLIGPQGGKMQAAVVPDAYFVLVDGEYTYHHFLEVDRGTETGKASKWGRRDYSHKIEAYLAYYNSGKYEARYHTKSLRILTVTTSEKRAAHLKAVTEAAGGRSRFWFTTFENITPTQVLTQPIWYVANREGLHALLWQ